VVLAVSGTGLSEVLDTGDPVAVLRRIARSPVDDLIKSLGNKAMLHYVESGDGLLAVSVVDGRVRLHPLGRPAAGAGTLRLVLGAAAAARVARRIDDVLLAPLRPLLGTRPLVVVPAAVLHGMPWAALPTCAGRAVSVAPSVPEWLRAGRLPSTLDNPVWVAGPGLRHADREVATLRTRCGGTLLNSRQSTVDRVRAAIGGADLVHIAAHGRYRPGAPHHSCLELADGPLYGHDFGAGPRILVLSACEGALCVPLAPGTRAVIASTVPVADAAAAGLFTTFYEHFHRGPAEALARAQAEHGDRGFVCTGAG
jgi:hypothetical protein